MLSGNLLKLLSKRFHIYQQKVSSMLSKLNQLWMYCRERARIAGAIVRGVYVPRVNHLDVISWPLAPIDITAIDCDLLPNVVQMQSFGHRPSALTGTARTLYSPMQSYGRWHLLALQSYCVNHSTNFKQKVIQLRNNYTIIQ